MKNVKTIFSVIVVATIMTLATFTGCKSQQQTTSSGGRNPFGGGTYEAPCAVYDDDKNFAATGIASGPSTQMGSIQRVALGNAQDMIRAKMEHAYEGFIDNYMESIGANRGTDIETETRGVGRQTILQIVGNASHSCLKFSDVDNKGNVNCYIAVTIPKERIAQAVADNLSKSQKAEIRNRAADARKEMNEYFKNLKNE